MKTPTESFKEFALKSLIIHVKELYSRYKNDNLLNEVMLITYSTHKTQYHWELNEKIDDLVKPDNIWLRVVLNNLKQSYLSKLELILSFYYQKI